MASRIFLWHDLFMIPVREAQKLIERHTMALEAEVQPLAGMAGRVLREPVASAEDIPGFDRSAMDGYAVRADDPADEFEVVGEIRAGESMDRELAAGQAMRIFTGARLPGAGLKVVMQEHVEAQGARLRVTTRMPGSNVRHRGEDARAGEVLLEPGAVLDATAIALLASVGRTSVLVSRQPRILHITTGDEVIAPELTPMEGQIRNSNASLIAGLCREFGVEAIRHVHSSDDLPALLHLVSGAKVETYDMVLISGGSGQGTYDFSGEVFKHLGATVHFRQVDVRPGKPLIFGVVAAGTGGTVPGADPSPGGRRLPTAPPMQGSQIIFGLPGNALSHFVCFHLFVRLALGRLLAKPRAATVQGFLAESMVDTQNSRETWWPARASLKEGRLECRALPWKSSGDITRLPGANVLIKVPASTSGFDVGTMVEVLPTRDFLC